VARSYCEYCFTGCDELEGSGRWSVKVTAGVAVLRSSSSCHQSQLADTLKNILHEARLQNDRRIIWLETVVRAYTAFDPPEAMIGQSHQQKNRAVVFHAEIPFCFLSRWRITGS
jgi:hypothetical protein